MGEITIRQAQVDKVGLFVNSFSFGLLWFLRQHWDNKLYRSWPKLVHPEIIQCPAVDATLFY